MSAHTPGPWKAKGARVLSPSSCGFVECCGIAECFHGSQMDVAAANARLIAAAPDLLAFAVAYTEMFNGEGPIDEALYEHACAAIRKATDE